VTIHKLLTQNILHTLPPDQSTACHSIDALFFNFFFEAEPFATILIVHRTSSNDSYIGTVVQSQMGKAMTSNAFTHKRHNHNENEFCSINAKSIFQ